MERASAEAVQLPEHDECWLRQPGAAICTVVPGLHVDPEIEPPVHASDTPLSGPLLCALLPRLGPSAVESLTLDVELPGGSGDLLVEAVEPAEGLGVLVLEPEMGVAPALEVGQVPFSLWQINWRSR
jgi:hypothetical protein